MNTKHLNSEKGQAIVFLVIGLVVFLGFVALAIDGGMTLADRRDAQNATDASALAGASAAAQQLGGAIVDPKTVTSGCTSSQLSPAEEDAETAAVGRADSNHYTITESNAPDVANSVYVHCGVSSGPYMDVSVEISKTTPTSFLQVLVPNANLTNMMMSVARLHTARALGRGNTLVALNSGDSLYVGGSTLIHIFGGGVFGNDDAFCSNDKDKIFVCKPTNADPATAIANCEADLSNQILTGSVNIAGDNLNCGKASYIPSIKTGAPPMDPSEYTLPEPVCTGRNYGTGYANLPNSLSPGLYCVHGSKTLDNYFKNSRTADGVTFYLVDKMAFNFNSNKVYELSAPKVGTEGINGAIPGLLFFAPPENTSEITVNGNSGSYFYGTWLLPGVIIKSFNGTGGISFRGQLIVGDFDTNGTFDGAMYYDEDYVVTIPASIDLLK